MTKQEFIDKLLECSEILRRLAEHLESWDCTSEDIELCADVADDMTTDNNADSAVIADNAVNEADAEITEMVAETAPHSAHPQAGPTNPFARLFSGLNQNTPNIPAAANPFNLLNMLAGGKGSGLSGLSGMSGMNLPSTLAELHDNPQIMSMLNQVASNPQSLNMISGLTGQSPEALQAALNALQPAASAAPTTPPAPPVVNAPAAPPMAQVMPMSGAPQMVAAENMSATAHLNSLLAQWHWSPYARVWAR